MLIGYARVSRGEDQDLSAQRQVLQAAGVERIHEEAMSGGIWDRPELHRALEHLRAEDVLVVTKLDRLSRSLKDLLALLERIDAAGAGFRSLGESIDTTTPAGRMMMQMIGSFAEYEREMIRERTRAGLQAARRQGRVGGRPPALNAEQRDTAIRMITQEGWTAADVARLFNVHPSTISRLVSAQRHAP